MRSRKMGKRELVLVGRKIGVEIKEMKKKGLGYIDEEEALKKYRKPPANK